MQTMYDTWNPEPHVADGMIFRLLRCVSERKRRSMRSFVMKEMYAHDYRICEDYAQVEIRDGFNSNLVVQYYEEKNKIIIYIPRGWKKKIIIEVREGNISCRQQIPYQGLRMFVTRGKIFCRQEAYA